MNIDANILYKTLGHRIQRFVKRERQFDYIGFIPEMKGYLYIQKSINIIRDIDKWSQKNMIISLDNENIFDKIQQDL